MIYLHFKWGGYSKSEVDTLLDGKADTSHNHTKSQITDLPTIPSKTSDLTNDSGFLTSHQDLSGYVPKGGGQVFTGTSFSRTENSDELAFNGGISWNDGASIALRGKDKPTDAGVVYIKAQDATSYNQISLYPSGTCTRNVNGTVKNLAMQEDVIPRSGGAVITGYELGRTADDTELRLCGGTSLFSGATVIVYGKDYHSPSEIRGRVLLQTSDGSNIKDMSLYPSGTWTWDGTAVQLTSDQRLKQQISKIDNALLDAWEDVDLVQFKYNDAVDSKGDNARLHTGYVVQQIDEACQKHDVDISEYGLYCHEEYTERTEEVTIENEDGTTSKETKVVEPAKEYYSLRYTETLVVECAYLRREVSKLKQQNENLEQRLKMLEQAVK